MEELGGGGGKRRILGSRRGKVYFFQRPCFWRAREKVWDELACLPFSVALAGGRAGGGVGSRESVSHCGDGRAAAAPDFFLSPSLVGGDVVDDEPEHVVLDEEGVVGRLQDEALDERLGAVFVRLERKKR